MATVRRTGERADADARKLALLRRSGLFGTDTKGAKIERACTFDDLREAYRLVHDIYLGTGFVRAEPSGLRLRIFETTSETATFIAKKNGRVVGVLSVVGDSGDLGLPSDTAFKAELDALRATGARLCEITNQVVDEAHRRSAVSTELMRCAIAHQIKGGYHFAVASVSPSHTAFYNLLGFDAVGSERSYSQKLHDPVVALCLNIDRYRNPARGLGPTAQFIHDLATTSNPFLSKVGVWAKRAVRNFLNPQLLKQLFVENRNFLGECSAEELLILQRRWGQEMYNAVLGPTYPPFAPKSPQRIPVISGLGASGGDLQNGRPDSFSCAAPSLSADASLSRLALRRRVLSSPRSRLRFRRSPTHGLFRKGSILEG